MSKFSGRFSYKTWLILKHGLRNSIQQKEKELERFHPDSYEEAEEYKKLEKDIKEEKEALKDVSEFIKKCKEDKCINIQDKMNKKSNIAICICGFSVPKYDDDGFGIEGDYSTIDEGDMFEVSNDSFRVTDEEIRLESQDLWIEVSKHTFERHFEMLDK